MARTHLSLLGITLTVGSHTFSTLYTGLMQLTVQNDLASSNYPDAFGAVADVKVGNTFSLAGFVLGDKTGTVFSSTALPTSLDLSQFTVGEVNLVSPSANGTNVFVGTINLSSVPEPASMTLMALGVIGAAAWSLGRSASVSAAASIPQLTSPAAAITLAMNRTVA